MKEDQFTILDKETLSDPEKREQIFHELKEYFGEPCLPVSKYCNALETFASILAKNDPKFGEMYYRYQIDVRKSCLLDRLIYCGEELRMEKCPKHNGVWSGMGWDNDCECRGSCGCLTGWLPNKGEVK